MSDDLRPRWDLRGMAVVFAAAATLYAFSTAPGVFWGDSGEFARRAATLDLSPVARGYPLHRVLTWAAGRLTGSPAYGANLVSALFGAVAAALAHETGRRLSGSRAGGFAAAAALALCPTFWLFSGVAEVYTLHAAILLGLILTVLGCDSAESAPDAKVLRQRHGTRAASSPFGWRASPAVGVTRSRASRLAFGALVGVSFLHHRMTAFAFPGLGVWLAVSLWRSRADGRTLRRVLEVAAGFAAGILPFVLLCALASRSPPEGVPWTLHWWWNDVFVGGEKNAEHLFGAGRKSALANLGYVTRWVVYDLPGPALALAGWGYVRLLRRGHAATWPFAVLLGLHLVFPFRYDWTGDQFSFLTPFYATAAPLVAVGVAGAEERWGARAGRVCTGLVAAVPIALALALAFTPLGARMLPGISEEARRLLVLPLRPTYRTPERTCTARLAALPGGALLHTDWGDGQVYLYLQEVEGLRPDVDVEIWYGGGPRLTGDAREEWVSAMPGTLALPAAVRALGDRLEPRGDRLWRVRKP